MSPSAKKKEEDEQLSGEVYEHHHHHHHHIIYQERQMSILSLDRDEDSVQYISRVREFPFQQPTLISQFEQ